MSTSPFSRRLRKKIALPLLSTLAVLFLLGCAVLTLRVYFQLDELTAARSDNMEYTIARLEVDHVAATLAAERLDASAPDSVKTFRRRFDALYNRVDTLLISPLYAGALAALDMRADLENIKSTFDGMLPLVDGDDAALIAAAPRVAATLAVLNAHVQKISSASLWIDAARSRAERADLARTLLELAAISLLLLAALVALLFQLWTLYTRFRKRAMENRMTLRRLSTILNTSLDHILVIDPNGRILEANTAAVDALGLSGANGARKAVTDVLLRPSDDGTPVPFDAARLFAGCRAGRNRSADIMARRADGTLFPAELSAALAMQAGREVCICYLRDISQRLDARKEIETARDRALAGERSKARFLSMISHEMRTPLNGILGTVDLLVDTDLNGEQTRYARIIQSAGQQLLTQINDALDLTQAGSGRLSLETAPFDFDALLDEAVAGLMTQAETAGTRLQVTLPEGPIGIVEGDRARVLQVLVNLVSNAVKFTARGDVSVEARWRDADHREIEVQVADNGCGIPEADLPHIFEDFVRGSNIEGADVPGSGLGLGIVRELVQAMRGHVEADSIHGEGSLFSVRLPLPARAAVVDRPAAENAGADGAAEAAADTDEDAAPAPLQILVVEDNEASRFVVSQMLRKDGHAVTEVSDGQSALRCAARRVFDLVVMDVRMPGIDGLETARRLRTLPGASSRARLVFLTAHIRTDATESFAELRPDAVLAKPLRRAALRDVLAGRIKDPALTAPTPGPVDTLVLDQLQDMLPKDSFAGLLSRFRAEGEAFHGDIETLAALPDAELVSRLHAFAGSAATFGAHRLQAHLTRTETALTGQDPARARGLLRDVPDLWRDTARHLPDTDDVVLVPKGTRRIDLPDPEVTQAAG